MCKFVQIGAAENDAIYVTEVVPAAANRIPENEWNSPPDQFENIPDKTGFIQPKKKCPRQAADI